MNKNKITLLIAFFMISLLSVNAQEKQTPSSPEDQKAALMGGVPAGRWKEGLLYDVFNLCLG